MSYSSTIAAAAQQWGVPPQVLAWQIQQESSGNPNAYNPSSGTAGIAQFSPSTAQEFGINPYDPNASINAAAQYDAQLYQQTGSWTGALTRYGTLANVPQSVWQSWQPVAQSVGETGTPAGQSSGLLSWLPSWLYDPNAANVRQQLAQQGAWFNATGSASGSPLDRWQELGVRVAIGALGAVLVAAGLFLAGRRVPGVAGRLSRALPGASYL